MKAHKYEQTEITKIDTISGIIKREICKHCECNRLTHKDTDKFLYRRNKEIFWYNEPECYEWNV